MGGDLPGDDEVLVIEIDRVGTTDVLRSQLDWPEIAPKLAEMPGANLPTNWAEAASALCSIWETLLAQGQPIEIVDDDGVFHVIPAAAVLAIRCHRLGPKAGDAQMARRVGFRPPTDAEPHTAG